MRILNVTDAWEPQVNGVVTTLKKIKELSKEDIIFITPNNFRSYPNPFYSEIKICFPTQEEVSEMIRGINPDHIHISTEGPIGWSFRRWCIDNNVKFTTSYHTKFPEFLKAQFSIPTWMTYWFFRKFHKYSKGVFVATPSLQKELKQNGFKNLIPWSRGVDIELFKPDKKIYNNILLYVGRISKEKNIEEFLKIDMPEYKKVVIGDGPILNDLKKKYSEVHFTGTLKGEQLAFWYRNADCFVFPSKSDTFGLVILESLASGTPVAAYPVTGPIDIIIPQVGYVNDNLEVAIKNALLCDRTICRNYAEQFSWQKVVDVFIERVKNI
jgi:glycosyltransferase involved in cell wall biosynthesis